MTKKSPIIGCGAYLTLFPAPARNGMSMLQSHAVTPCPTAKALSALPDRLSAQAAIGQTGN